MFFFTKGMFLDCQHDMIVHSNTYNDIMDINVQKKPRIMALGPCMKFFELSDEEFLIHSVAEII